MLRFAPLAALMLSWPLAPSWAQPRDMTPMIETCTVDTAKPATIAQLHTDPELRFKCVSIEGALYGQMVHINRRAIVEPVEPSDGYGMSEEEAVALRAASPPATRVRLQRSSMPGAERPRRARVVGVVNDCSAIYREANAYHERLNAERTDGRVAITFLSGTCHYHGEVYVHPVAVTYLDFEPLLRFTSAEVEPDKTGLVPITEKDAAEGLDLAVGAALIRAIDERDEGAYHMLRSAVDRPSDFTITENLAVEATTPSPGTYFNEDEEWAAALGVAESANAVDYGLRQLFHLRSAIEHQKEYPEDPDDLEVVACWCKTRDCEGKWPVFYGDADAHRSRPYMCVILETVDVSGREKRVTTGRLLDSDLGFAEPEWDGDGNPS